jgi:hypothetical protein
LPSRDIGRRYSRPVADDAIITVAGALPRNAALSQVSEEKTMPRLLSINVGLPQDIVWRGKVVRTAVWKTPVQGRRMVRRLNVDGDGQGDLAGHGGEHRAVFVYQIDSYRYWQHRLGRSDFSFGQFGENFTREMTSHAPIRGARPAGRTLSRFHP